MTPADLTDADVAAWLLAKVAEQNLPDCSLSVFTSVYFPGKVRFLAQATVGKEVLTSEGQPTAEEAFDDIRAQIKTPAVMAAEKRAAAEKLLREADELETKATE